MCTYICMSEWNWLSNIFWNYCRKKAKPIRILCTCMHNCSQKPCIFLLGVVWHVNTHTKFEGHQLSIIQIIGGNSQPIRGCSVVILDIWSQRSCTCIFQKGVIRYVHMLNLYSEISGWCDISHCTKRACTFELLKSSSSLKGSRVIVVLYKAGLHTDNTILVSCTNTKRIIYSLCTNNGQDFKNDMFHITCKYKLEYFGWLLWLKCDFLVLG